MEPSVGGKVMEKNQTKKKKFQKTQDLFGYKSFSKPYVRDIFK